MRKNDLMIDRCSSPEELLASAKLGDSLAMGQLLEIYRNYLDLLGRLHLGRMLQSKADSADLVQDTFLDAHRQFSHFRGASEGEFIAWLRQILAGNLANLVRRYKGTQGRDVRLERQLADELDQSSRALQQNLAATQSTPSQRAVRRELEVLLADALGQLRDDYRDVIILHHLEGLTFPETAQRMGRTVDSVKHLWAPALAQLRLHLGELA
jgi:RNA polymerase sigma-70 factor (ECF subfamily)